MTDVDGYCYTWERDLFGAIWGTNSIVYFWIKVQLIIILPNDLMHGWDKKENT